MAICNECRKEMLTADGCDIKYVNINGFQLERIKCGDPDDLHDIEPGERCHDCGALYGHYHHPGCDAERCPHCGHQLLSCDCEEVDFDIIRKPFIINK